MVTLAAASVNQKSGFINILGVMGSGEWWVNHECRYQQNRKFSRIGRQLIPTKITDSTVLK